MYIKPSTKIRNEYNVISDLARETREPIYITKNGEGDGVYMNLDAFEEREMLIRLEMELEIAERYKLSGQPTFSTEDVRKRIEGILANE